MIKTHWTLLLVAALSSFSKSQNGLFSQAEETDKKVANGKEQVEIPPFPHMYHYDDGAGPNLRPIGKIVSEVSAMGSRVVNQEEYIDWGAGKFALTNSNTREVFYVSANDGLRLRYRPYTCQRIETDSEIDPTGTFYSLRLFGQSEGKQKWLRVYGVMGLWLHAAYKGKGHKRTKQNFGVEGFEKVQHHFLAPYDEKLEIEFIFSQAMTLESVELRQAGSNVPLKRYKILSIEFGTERINEHVLELPVGYDCSTQLGKNETTKQDDDSNQQELNDSTPEDFWRSYLWSDSRVKLEVTATKFSSRQDQADAFTDDARSSSADTIYVELAHAGAVYSNGPVSDEEAHNGLVQTKVKSKRQETRTILNHRYNVRYHIDSQTGKCEMSHLQYGKPGDAQAVELEDEARDGVDLEFANGLKFPLHKRQLETLFSNSALLQNFRVLKKVTRPSLDSTQLIEFLILERPQFKWPYNEIVAPNQQRWARVMATVLVATDIPTGQVVSREVESVTVWLLAPDQASIDESYHFSVVKRDFPLELYPDVAQLFDVSEECYLNDPEKRSGLDYAWAELFYPMSSRRLDVLIENEFQLKQSIYASLTNSPLFSVTNMPRLEVMFADEGLIVRVLLLDLPHLDLLFDSKRDVKLVDAESLLMFVLPDERHCARMCKLNDCLAMSYCSNSNCAMSSAPAKLYGETAPVLAKDDPFAGIPWKELKPESGCVTYSHSNPSLVQKLRRQNLARVISLLQNQDYDNLELPEMPDEIALPRDETDVSQSDYKKLLETYWSSVADFLSKQGVRTLSLLLSMHIQGHFIVVLPTRFTLEDDPMDQFSLGTSTDLALRDPRQIVQFFHAGCSEYSLLSGHALNEVASDKRNHLTWFTGLTYDQCALACLDSSCGIFSHCKTSLNCVMSNVGTIQEAFEMNIVGEDKDCLISQRDYAQHFQKYTRVERPHEWESETSVKTVNDCATSCVTSAHFNCYAFEFCTDPNKPGSGKCYQHDHRNIGYRLPASAENGTKTRAENSSTCELYQRDYLAEFTQIQFHKFTESALTEFVTTLHRGRTSFECADYCLNAMAECSAFEFCFQSALAKENPDAYGQTCRMILTESQASDKAAFVVDDFDPLDLRPLDPRAKSEQWPLVHSASCHVFALKPNTVQAHLRNLALGQTMTKQELETERHRLGSLGLSFTWSGLFLLVLTLVCVSSALGFGLCWARERNGSVRHRMDQLEAALKRPFGRLANPFSAPPSNQT